MAKMKFGKNLSKGYKRAQSKLDYYNKKFGITSPVKSILSESRKQYSKALREYKKGNIPKSEVLAWRQALQTTVKSIEKTYSKKSRIIKDISTNTQRDEDLTKYSRMLGTHNTFGDNALDKFEDIADILNMDVDDLLGDLYSEGQQVELFYKTNISEAVSDDSAQFESHFLEKYRERAERMYYSGEIEMDELTRVSSLLS